MKIISKEKIDHLINLSNTDKVISALAIDQRGSLRKMLAEDVDDVHNSVKDFKNTVSEELTKYSSSILLDPEYGIPASKRRAENSGLLLAYEETGYDASEPGRLPDLLPEWSVKRIKEMGSDAVKFLLYYDIDESEEINDWKHAFTERIGSECEAEDIPFFLEIITYDAAIEDTKGKEYAKIKPHKVNEAIKEFSKGRYDVDVLKIEVPVNMNFVEGYNEENEEFVYTKEEAENYFKEQNDATDLPYIYLSAGVSAEMFQETLKFARESGAEFNGVLCGRATWKGSVPAFAKGGVEGAREWLQTEGKRNIEELNEVLEKTAVPWSDKFQTK